MVVTGPCQRCVVPTRDSQTGVPTPQFMKIFMERRGAALPKHLQQDPRFEKNSYRLTVNVLGAEEGIIQVGDSVKTGVEVKLRDFHGKTSAAITANS